MISCGKQCLTCDYPVHMDTYRGCAHGCLYCATRKKYNISAVKPLRSVVALRNFISGKRTQETKWCDWAIPLHWGANSDPFQPCELEHGASLECLRIFAETKYPFIVSTKNPVMLTRDPYLSVISDCNAVVQISMACGKYDRLEPGAPCYEDRLAAAAVLAPRVRRVVARVQPFFPDALEAILGELPRYKEAGIHGIIAEAFVSANRQKGMIRENSTYIFPNDLLAPMMKRLKARCAELGLDFTCTTGGLTWLSDSHVCCGCAGLDDFRANTFHLDHIAQGDAMEPTAAMTDQPCPQPFKCIGQSQAWALQCKGKSFAELMLERVADYSAWYNSERIKYDFEPPGD